MQKLEKLLDPRVENDASATPPNPPSSSHNLDFLHPSWATVNSHSS